MAERFADGPIAGEDRCRSWPRTCAERQAMSSTYVMPCDFCRYGPPAEPPVRRDTEPLSVEEAHERIEATERETGDRLRAAVIAAVDATPEKEDD